MIRSLPPAESGVHEGRIGEARLHRVAEALDERDVVLAQRVEGATGSKSRPAPSALRSAIRSSASAMKRSWAAVLVEELGHLRVAVGRVEELEGRDDPDAAVVGGVGDGGGIVADVFLVADPVGVDGAVRLDAEPEERDRRDELVAEPVDRARVEAPVRQVAVDLVGERLDARDARPDLGGGPGRGPSATRPAAGSIETATSIARAGAAARRSGRWRSHPVRKAPMARSVHPPVGPGPARASSD